MSKRKPYQLKLQMATKAIMDNIENEHQFKSDLQKLRALIEINKFNLREITSFKKEFNRVKNAILENQIINLPKYQNLKAWLNQKKI